MNYRLTSSKRIFAKLYRDLRLTDSRYVTDIVEWIGEAMQHIKAYPTLEQKVVTLDVAMHRVELPTDLAQIKQVARTRDGGDTLEIMSYNASTFPRSLHTRDSPNKFSRHSENRYIINYNYIETNFEEGQLVLAYMAFPVDEDNYPMVPDEVSFDEAAKWYVALRMTEGGWQHPGKLDYTAIEQRWHHYCAQARQKINMPDIDQYQKFLEMWVRLVPDYSRHQFAFEDKDLLAEDFVDARGIVTQGVDQISGFGEIGDPDASPSPSPS